MKGHTAIKKKKKIVCLVKNSLVQKMKVRKSLSSFSSTRNEPFLHSVIKLNYNLIDIQVVLSDQSMDAVHPFSYKKEVKIIKVGTIILISYMAMTFKIIAMFSISIGALAPKVTLLIYIKYNGQ